MKGRPGYRATASDWLAGRCLHVLESEHYSLKAALRSVADMQADGRYNRAQIETIETNPRVIWRGEFLEG